MVNKYERKMSKTVYTDKTIDGKTGEVLAIRIIDKKNLKTEERFIKTYLDDLGALIKCTNAEKNFILCCIKKGFIGFETNEIWLDKRRKEEVAECADLDLKSVYNIMYRLGKKNIIVTHNGAKYLNPKLFFTGDERSRNKMFELKIKYTL